MTQHSNKHRYGRFEKRRQLVDRVCVFCAVCIIWILIVGKNNELTRHIASDSFYLFGTVVVSYIGGRTINEFKLPDSQDCDKEDKPDGAS